MELPRSRAQQFTIQSSVNSTAKLALMTTKFGSGLSYNKNDSSSASFLLKEPNKFILLNKKSTD